MKAVRNQNRSSQASARGRASNRGSAMLLAVGLVTILAMLGTTFLLISRMNRRTSEAIIAKTPVDHLAAGVVSQVVTKLTEDLYIDATNGPYGDTATGVEGWLQYVDYAGDDPGMDNFLWSNNGTTQHVSNVLGTGTADASADSTSIEPPFNAYLADTYVMNSGGKIYKVAVQVIDTSSLINVNIACYNSTTASDMPDYGSPVGIDLRGFLYDGDDDEYDALNDTRCGWRAEPPVAAQPSLPSDINTNIALKLFNPTAGYAPFSTGNESYLRWLGTDANGRTETGTLYESGAIAAGLRKYLTTYNASRAIVRHPATGFTTQAMLNVSNTPTIDVPTVTYREAAYEQMKAYLTELGVGGDASKMAAHFVANLWAYTSTDDPTTEPFRYEPATGVIVYGLVPQLVIAEAYAYHLPEHVDNPGAEAPTEVHYGDNSWGYAIELYNPSSTAIDISTYSLKIGASPAVTFASLSGSMPTSIPAGDRIVLYDFGDKNPTSPATPRTSDADEADFGFQTAAGWYKVTGLDFSGAAAVSISIFRTVGGYDIPVDQVTSTDFGYSCTDKVTEAEQIRYGQRDDGLTTGDNRARSTVAVMKLFNTGITNHKLGAANELNIADIDIVTATGPSPETAAFPVPILRPGASITNLGDCANIYFTGPEPNVDGKQAFPQQLIQPTFKAVFPDGPARGRLDFHPAYYVTPGTTTDIPAVGWDGGKYPDVPAAAMLSEFFNMIPPDGTKVYGRININTATKEVLTLLPWPADVNGTTVDIPTLVDYIIAYRDRQTVAGLPNYADRATATDILELRADPTAGTGSDCGGFLAAGELAIPLADYANFLLDWTAYTGTADVITTDAAYLGLRDSLYNAVSNLVTVNSDTYVVNIKIQLMDGDDEKDVWYYTTFIDRSSCTAAGDSPAILLNNMSKYE